MKSPLLPPPTQPKAGGLLPGEPRNLNIRNLSVVFDGFVAVDKVNLDVSQGDLRFLIGPNGAGKTTVIDAITGLVPASGSVNHTGTEILGRKVHQIARLGVGRTFQTASVFENLSVLQNLDIAAGSARGALELLRRRRKTEPAVEEAMDLVGLGHLAEKQAGVLSHGQKQWLEIGMLLVQNSDLLLLDEPIAGMSQDERNETGQLLRKIGSSRITLVIEHDMDFVREFATSVTVLAAGKVLSEGSVAEVQADRRVQEVYLGSAKEGGE